MQPSEPRAASVLEVLHLSKSFAGLKALDDVTGPDFNGGWVRPGRDGFTELF